MNFFWKIETSIKRTFEIFVKLLKLRYISFIVLNKHKLHKLNIYFWAPHLHLLVCTAFALHVLVGLDAETALWLPKRNPNPKLIPVGSSFNV